MLPDGEKDTAYTGRCCMTLDGWDWRQCSLIDTPAFCKSTHNSSAEILQEERNLFGMDHCHAGRLMVSAWNLPEDFIDIVSRHHEVRGVGKFNPLGLVNLSCRMTDALGFA